MLNHYKIKKLKTPDLQEALGFVATDVEQVVNGMRFTPMQHIFR